VNQKDLYKRLLQLKKDSDIPDTAKVIVVYKGISAEVRSLYYNLDDYDDPEWHLDCNDTEGEIDIDDVMSTDTKTKEWAKSLRPYVSYPIDFGKLMMVIGKPRARDEEVSIWLDSEQQKVSPIFVDEHDEYADITNDTMLQYDKRVNEIRFVIDEDDTY
jgi:hypothetical protein